MKKNAFGGLLLLATLAICRATQTGQDTFDATKVPSYVYLAATDKQAGKPTSGNAALTLELELEPEPGQANRKAQLCVREQFKVVGTHVEGGHRVDWLFRAELPNADGNAPDEQGPVEAHCTHCAHGCVRVPADGPLVRTVTAYQDLLPSTNRTYGFFCVTPTVFKRFDSLTYQEPGKKTTSTASLVIPNSVALEVYHVEPESTGTMVSSLDQPHNMACLSPLGVSGEPLEETIWYWSIGPANEKAALTVSPEASRKDKVPNGCIKYNQQFHQTYISRSATLFDKVIWGTSEIDMACSGLWQTMGTLAQTDLHGAAYTLLDVGRAAFQWRPGQDRARGFRSDSTVSRSSEPPDS